MVEETGAPREIRASTERRCKWVKGPARVWTQEEVRGNSKQNVLTYVPESISNGDSFPVKTKKMNACKSVQRLTMSNHCTVIIIIKQIPISQSIYQILKLNG